MPTQRTLESICRWKPAKIKQNRVHLLPASRSGDKALSWSWLPQRLESWIRKEPPPAKGIYHYGPKCNRGSDWKAYQTVSQQKHIKLGFPKMRCACDFPTAPIAPSHHFIRWPSECFVPGVCKRKRICQTWTNQSGNSVPHWQDSQNQNQNFSSQFLTKQNNRHKSTQQSFYKWSDLNPVKRHFNPTYFKLVSLQLT